MKFNGNQVILGIASSLLLCAGIVIADPSHRREQSWNFEEDEPGQIPLKFQSEAGRWDVLRDGGNVVVAQRAENRDQILNVMLNEETSFKNLELMVRIKPVGGENEGGGGLIWRARDHQNYYAMIYNPFVSRHKRKKPFIRLYKVENGKMTQLDHAEVQGESISDNLGEVPRVTEWHTLKVTMFGDQIVGYLDGERLLRAEDDTFLDVGRIGLLTKSDARTFFDDLKVATLSARENE